MVLINNKYNILTKIGIGSFGAIFKGENIRTNELVAIKVEPIKNGTKLLKNESIIYQYLSNYSGVPTIRWFGKDEVNYYMVINLLGESLESLKQINGNFSLKLTIQVGIKILDLLQYIHNKELVHRDIKPDNFLFGLNEYKNNLYIIDFGFCKKYNINNHHIQMKKTNGLIGSHSYASINAHNHTELSRRDDLESLGYLLIYLHMGTLEWQHEMNNEITINMKINTIKNSEIPSVLRDYLKITQKLEFDEQPNYQYLLNMFKREIELL